MSVEWVMYAGMAAWSGIGLYLYFIGRKQADLARRIRQLEDLETGGEGRE